uniref:Putative gamma-aminobutyric acid receptor subunit epsilon n=1 Tax=Ixodes ricinus TaxID=34613 RepID=A0A131Y9T5_IXORI
MPQNGLLSTPQLLAEALPQAISQMAPQACPQPCAQPVPQLAPQLPRQITQQFPPGMPQPSAQPVHRSVPQPVAPLLAPQPMPHPQLEAQPAGLHLFGSQPAGPQPGAPQLPLRTMEEFRRCELALLSESAHARMLARLSSLGGNSLKDTARIIMERTLRKDVQCRFSLLGRRPPKLAFRGTRLCTAIIAAVRARTKMDIVDIERCISRYLAGAADREGGRRQRHDK